MSGLGGFLDGIAQGIQSSRDREMEKQKQKLSEMMLKMQMKQLDSKGKQDEFTQNLLAGIFGPELMGGQQTSQGVNQFESQGVAVDSEHLPRVMPSTADIQPGSAGQQPGQGLLDKLSSLDPFKAAALKSLTGVDFPGALRDSKPGMGTNDIYARAIEGDEKAIQLVELIEKMKKAGSSQTTVNIPPSTGTIPPGYVMDYDQQNRPTQLSPIPGGPAQREIEEQEKKEAERQKTQERKTRMQYGTAIQDMQRALDIGMSSRLSVGAPYLLMNKIPESDANALKGMVDSAKSNVGINVLEDMRKASPTGGAVGQVPVEQQKKLEATIGNLDPSQRPNVFFDNLRRAINLYMDVVHGTPEEIQALVDKGEVQVDRETMKEIMFRYPLSFDERGKQKSKPKAEEKPTAQKQGGVDLRYNPQTGKLEPVQ
jgi:hypothetical protein